METEGEQINITTESVVQGLQGLFVEQFRKATRPVKFYLEAEMDGSLAAQEELIKVEPKEFNRKAGKMAHQALRQITRNELDSSSGKGKSEIWKTSRAIGCLSGVARVLDTQGKVLVWQSTIVENALRPEWSVRVKGADYQLKADEAIITTDKASDLGTMMSLNQRDLVVDLTDWFLLGIVDWKGKRLFDQGELCQESGSLALNRRTRFEPRLIALDDFEKRIETAVEQSLKGFECHAGERITEVKKVVERRKKAIIEEVRTHCSPYGKKQQEEDAAGRQSSAILKASPFELRRILETDLQELASQERSVDTLSQLWLLENMAKGLGLRTIVNKKGDYLLAQPSQIARMGKATQFADELTSALKGERRAGPKVKRADAVEERTELMERLRALGWDNLLAQAERMDIESGEIRAERVLGRKLTGRHLANFKRGLSKFGVEIERFLSQVAETVGVDLDEVDESAVLTAFYLRAKALAQVRPSGKEGSKDRNYWNGNWAGSQVLANKMGMRSDKASLMEKIPYSQGKSLDLKKQAVVFGKDGQDAEEIGLIVWELLEKIYGKEEYSRNPIEIKRK